MKMNFKLSCSHMTSSLWGDEVMCVNTQRDRWASTLRKKSPANMLCLPNHVNTYIFTRIIWSNVFQYTNYTFIQVFNLCAQFIRLYLQLQLRHNVVALINVSCFFYHCVPLQDKDGHDVLTHGGCADCDQWRQPRQGWSHFTLPSYITKVL